jgi:transcriptional regulator with XRE-family HTH domain
MASEPPISLADRLKERRRQLGLSQAQAARELDVARTAYRLWEMEAAKPAPDRWRLIASWLGISVTALLLAEDLVSRDEAASGDVIELDFGRRSGTAWDEAAASRPGDFFAQAKAVIAEGAQAGHMTDEQADELMSVIDRIAAEQRERATDVWQPAELRKTLRPDGQAPTVARQAVRLVAEDAPEEVLRVAELLTSEIVKNSVQHGESTNGGITLFVTVERDRLRVEIAEPAGTGQPELTTPGESGGFGLALVDELASRWGADVEEGIAAVWFELDLLTPGSALPPPESDR